MTQLWGEKQFLLIFVTLYWIDQKQLFKQIQIFPGFSPFKHGKTNKLSEFFNALFLQIVTFMSKKKSSLWISPKILQNNIKAQFNSMCLSLWRKTVFVNIYPRFIGLIKKQFFKQIQIFLRIYSLSNMVRKTNFLTISVLVSEIVTFMSKNWKVRSEFPQKCFKTTEKHSLAVCDSICGRKTVFVIICHLLLVWSKTVV